MSLFITTALLHRVIKPFPKTFNSYLIPRRMASLAHASTHSYSSRPMNSVPKVFRGSRFHFYCSSRSIRGAAISESATEEGMSNRRKDSYEQLKTTLMFSGLDHLEEQLIKGGVTGIEDLVEAADGDNTWKELVDKVGIGEKEADYLLQSLDLVSTKGVRIRNDDGSPMKDEKLVRIFGDSNYMKGDYEEDEIDKATEFLGTDLSKQESPEAIPSKEEVKEKMPVFLRRNLARKSMSMKDPQEVEARVASMDTSNMLPEFVIVGRTNTGKSTMINHLLNVKKLVQASRKPGKTTCVDIFDVNGRFNLADTPGYSVTENQVSDKWNSTWLPLVEAYMGKTPTITAGLFLVDIAKDVHKVDRQIVNLFKKHNIPILLVLTKDDKIIDRNHRMDRIKRIREGLSWPSEFPHVRYTSFTSNRSSKNAKVSRIQLRKALATLISMQTKERARLFLEGMDSDM